VTELRHQLAMHNKDAETLSRAVENGHSATERAAAAERQLALEKQEQQSLGEEVQRWRAEAQRCREEAKSTDAMMEAQARESARQITAVMEEKQVLREEARKLREEKQSQLARWAAQHVGLQALGIALGLMRHELSSTRQEMLHMKQEVRARAEGPEMLHKKCHVGRMW